eukprot:4264050-Karenia_brevis.AAC.1
MSVVAFADPVRRQTVFATCFAHLFGLSAAVLNYNRIPAVLVSFLRRAFLLPCWNFFDDVAAIRLAL